MFPPKWRHNSKIYRAEYNAWESARRRCTNPKASGWINYGARGISMCARWLNDFDAFIEDMGPRPAGGSIERKNVDGNYEPENCIWETSHAQARNKRSTRRLTFRGKTRIAADWADILGIPRNTFYARLDRGFSENQIFSKETLVASPKHGTISMYVGHKCRCERCRAANAEYAKNRRLMR